MTYPQRIKFYSDAGYLLPGQRHAQFLFPFWGKNPEEPGNPVSGRYDRYMEIGRQFFEPVSLEEADVAVFPGETGDWDNMRDNALRFGMAAKAAGKPAILFFCADSAEPIDIPNGMVFRTSLYKSVRRPGEFAMPSWSEDFVVRYWHGILPVRPKREKPVVGFCGQPGPISQRQKFLAALGRVRRAVLRRIGPAGTRVKLMAGQVREGPFKGLNPSTPRAKALLQLSRSSLVEKVFIFKPGHFGGALKADGEMDPKMVQRARQDFVENMLASDYVVCARGGGNFSYRLYETLGAGRIPLFINTDCVLPYENHIDWKRYCVWIEADEISSIDQRLAEFHAKLSPDDFGALQQECRNLWLEWLSPEGFFSKLHLDVNDWIKHLQT
jgi:hypothetical protein